MPIGDPDYYAALGAVNVLSGSMSSRLFTEIREKEGLCYSVWASYQTLKDRARIISYAGSRNERAQRTLDLLLRELRRLPEGIENEESYKTIVRLGCEIGQGWYFGKPMPAEQAKELLDARDRHDERPLRNVSNG